MTEQDILEIICEWKYFWMNQTQNSKEDYENYRRRAFGIDANMKHSLAKRIHEKLKSNTTSDFNDSSIFNRGGDSDE